MELLCRPVERATLNVLPCHRGYTLKSTQLMTFISIHKIEIIQAGLKNRDQRKINNILNIQNLLLWYFFIINS